MGTTELNITLILVFLTGFISWQGFRKPEFANKLLHMPYRVKHQKEYFRLLAAGFVHGNWTHLLINLYVLYQFGGVVELLFGYLFGPTYGLVVFVVFYLTSIVVSSLPAYFRHQDNPGYGELGASGATSALVFIYILMDPWQWFLFPPLPAILVGLLYLWYSNYMSKHNPGDHIAHSAHFAGAVYGLAFVLVSTFFFRPVFLEQFIVKLLHGPTSPF
ncbi:MAG: hypothetical protein KIPDCIKN_03158 [Haliscomenobacter sp.]|jgi:membrane associated rhomboid family serine protease|nr:hypothetical protein [Haliscomenobacter sp.]